MQQVAIFIVQERFGGPLGKSRLVTIDMQAVPGLGSVHCINKGQNGILMFWSYINRLRLLTFKLIKQGYFTLFFILS